MRFSLLILLASSALVYSKADKEIKKEPTIFNSQKVPPLAELTPKTWASELKQSKFVLVKHFSPYCAHCTSFAPTFQTLYEFYFTSNPASANAKDKSFSDYYDFKFATLNCVAFSDLCYDHGVTAYPTTILYKEGKPVGTLAGSKGIDELGELVEEALEAEYPGTRPKLVTLPMPGDHESPASAPKSKSTDKKPTKLDDALEIDTKKDGQKPSGTGGKADKSAATGEKAGFGKGWKVPTAAENYNAKKPKKPSTLPNPDGESVSLTPESFQRLVTKTTDPWFIKFYAPWCPHCQALAPTWIQVAKHFKGKVNIGEVNCDREKRLCKDAAVHAYPAIFFYKGLERAAYDGLRGLGDFVHYGEKALELAAGVPDVDIKSFEKLHETEEVIFVYFYDHATTIEDFTALERLPLNLIGHAKVVKTNDKAMIDRFQIATWPRLLVSREGRPTYFTPLTPNEMRDTNSMLEWMRSVWLPLVPEVTASNARQIMDGKVTVLAVLDREDNLSYQSALREMKSAANEWMDRTIQEFQLERKKLREAKQMRIDAAEERKDERAVLKAKTIRINMEKAGKKEVTFAWVDGVFWQRWVKTTYGVDVKEGQRVIINDQDSRKYWEKTVTGNNIMVSRTSIMETLDKAIYTPSVLQAKSTLSTFAKFFFDMRMAFIKHPYLCTVCVIGVLYGFVSWLRGRSRRARAHFRPDDHHMGMRDAKDGLLGQNGYTKAD